MDSNFQIREDNLIAKDLIKEIISSRLPAVKFEPSVIASSPVKSGGTNPVVGHELLLHKRIGNFQFFSDCETSYERDKSLEEKDELLEAKLPAIIKHFKRRAIIKKQALALEEFEQKKQLMIQSYKVYKAC
jgi:hypothetical protein